MENYVQVDPCLRDTLPFIQAGRILCVKLVGGGLRQSRVGNFISSDRTINFIFWLKGVHMWNLWVRIYIKPGLVMLLYSYSQTEPLTYILAGRILFVRLVGECLRQSRVGNFISSDRTISCTYGQENVVCEISYVQIEPLTLKAPRKKCIWKCRLL